MEFFRTSTTNLLRYTAKAGIGHYVALSVVGTDRLTESGYFRAKIVQETLIRESGIPYSIVHATQFFEFVKAIADFSTVDGKVRLSSALIQPTSTAWPPCSPRATPPVRHRCSARWRPSGAMPGAPRMT